MRLFGWFGQPSSLQMALQRGLAEGGNLAEELQELGKCKIRSRADARAICRGLELLIEGSVPRGKPDSSPLSALTGLFQNIENTECAAFSVLQDSGSALLSRIVRQGLEQEETWSSNDLLFVLKVLAMYGTRRGTDVVIEAVRKPLAPDDYLWNVILKAFAPGHPEAIRLFTSLAHPLPPDSLAKALLDAANRFCLDGGEMRHPFDSDEGLARLKIWLSVTAPEKAGHAIGAAAAIPFLNDSRKEQLLSLALGHANTSVAMEAAWAAAKLGNENGLERLAQFCLDIDLSAQARRYLDELGRADAVPAEAQHPGFQARAEFAEWLAHPLELGRRPDAVEIVDHRELRWPPDFQPKPFWLLRYRAKARTALEEDDVGIGLVGSITFCLFGEKLDERPPEDGYALHCCWQLRNSELLEIAEVDENSTEYDSLMAQWKGPPFETCRVKNVAELSPALNQPHRLVAIAAAKLGGDEGWAVLDGDDSRWYPADEMPKEEECKTVLKIHIGRKLLQFPDTKQRGSWLKSAKPRLPEEIIAAYEKTLSAVESPTASKTDLKHFDRVLRWHFASYIESLLALGQREKIKELVGYFAPRWQHNLGYGLLGTAAFRVGDFDLAESFLLKLKAGMEDWHRCEEMGLLAESWYRRGQHEAARSLLVECLGKLLVQGRKATGSDRTLFEDCFQNHRKTFLHLFPGGSEDLEKAGIHVSTK